MGVCVYVCVHTVCMCAYCMSLHATAYARMHDGSVRLYLHVNMCAH